MEIEDSLRIFLTTATSREKRDRILNFLSSKKGQVKFFKLLSHDFIKYLDNSNFIPKLSEKELDQSGYLYCSHKIHSKQGSPLKILYNSAPWEGSWLLISESGKVAIYRPEGKIDDEIHIRTNHIAGKVS